MTKPSKAKQQPQLAPEDQLRERRTTLGLSRREVAEEAAVPVSRVWAAEHKDVGVEPEDRKKIVDVLNKHVQQIASLQLIS